jgi:hypothetical protein
MKATFIGSGPDDETKVCTMFGIDFFRKHEVDVSELTEMCQVKLRGNRHFEVVGDEPAKRGPGRPRKVDQEAVTDGDVQD